LYNEEQEFDYDENSYDSDSFENDKADSPVKQGVEDVIKELGKEQRDILRESLSTIKWGLKNNEQLEEEIIEEIETKPKLIEVSPIPKQKIIMSTLYQSIITNRQDERINEAVGNFMGEVK
jgi:arsenate reductase-like glutaredoxin family protein